MLNKKQQKILSQTLSHALRHEPWLYELELDDQGFVKLVDILTAINGALEQELSLIAVEDIAQMIENSEEKRHEIIEGKVRALYGHSLPGLIAKTEFVPDTSMALYHATSPEAALSIMQYGLLPMARQYVHLSPSREVALEVGRRKSKNPVLLVINVTVAMELGSHFYQGNDKVVLADEIKASAVIEPLL
jgi:putative RNA 2'-phosphotransferase